MADVRINPTTLRHAGVANPAQQSVTDADRYLMRNNGRTWLLFENAGNADATVTFDVTRKLGGVVDAVDPTITVPAAAGGDDGRVFAGPFPPNVFNNGERDLIFSASAALSATALAG